MDTLQLLGAALGLATLAGLNLYLTVFATGLAIEQGWIDVSQTYPQLGILAHPAVLTVAGVLYFLEFFADKIPWIDSLWDTVHTVIRPLGGAFLAVRVLGTPDPTLEVIAALLAGSVTLMTHTLKAGTRLVANHSPEPFSNVALSVTEDAAVIGGLELIKHDPTLALIVFSVFLLIVAYFGPKLLRAAYVQAWLIFKKLTSPATEDLSAELPRTLPSALDIALFSVNLDRAPIRWAVPAISSSARNLPANRFGYLVSTEPTGEPAPRVVFLAKRRFRHIAESLDLTSYKIAHEPKVLSENVVFYSLEKRPKYTFRFARSQRPLVEKIVRDLQEQLRPTEPQTLPVVRIAETPKAEPALVE